MTERKLIPTRLPERISNDRAALDRLLDETLVGYLGLSLPEGPLVVPVSYARQGDRVLLHGSTGSPRMRSVAAGAQVCLTVAAVDAIEVARSATGTGMNFRSACLFGVCEVLDGAEKAVALETYVDRYLPGRSAEVRASTRREIAATMVLALPIKTWSMKVAQGFAEDSRADIAGPAWAGLVPLGLAIGEPIPSPDLRPATAVPGSVRAFLER